MTFLEWLARLFRRPAPAPPAPVGALGVVALVNRERSLAGVAPLVDDPRLAAAAAAWAARMAEAGGLTHGSVGARITAAGFRWTACAENVARGQQTAESVVAGWMMSPPHRKNILDPTLTHAGAGRSGDFWCLDFAC